MMSEQVLFGGVVMGFSIIHSVAGQPPLRQPDRGTDRQAARELIEATLQKAAEEEKPAEQFARYRKTSRKVIKLCANNLEVAHALKQATSKATEARGKRQAAKLMFEGLLEAQATLAFKPSIEAPLPEGFPDSTPVGEIEVKQYPKYRLARTQMTGAETVAFWTLFTHIKKKEIAMTAPVEMTYGGAGNDKLQRQAMAFLYRSTGQGEAGMDEKVEVIDIPAMSALSLGIRGDVTMARLAKAKAHLDAWLRQHGDEYEATGPLRVMGYNSPFVAVNRRFTEVEIPVRRKSPAH